jgi:hypothetical protein
MVVERLVEVVKPLDASQVDAMRLEIESQLRKDAGEQKANMVRLLLEIPNSRPIHATYVYFFRETTVT